MYNPEENEWIFKFSKSLWRALPWVCS
jgi:hypothetical protein